MNETEVNEPWCSVADQGVYAGTDCQIVSKMQRELSTRSWKTDQGIRIPRKRQCEYERMQKEVAVDGSSCRSEQPDASDAVT